MSLRVLFLGSLMVAGFCVTNSASGSAVQESGNPNLFVLSVDAAETRGIVRGDQRSSRRPKDKNNSFTQLLADTYALRLLDAWPLRSVGQTLLVFEGEVPLSDTQLAQLAGAYRFVRIAQRVQILTTRAAETKTAQRRVDEIGAVTAHRWSTGKGVRVAIIDTGADRRHPELRPRIVDSQDFTGRRMRGFDREAHGTAVASIIGGTRDGAGILGIAPDSELLVLRACLQRDAGYYNASCDTVALARALDHAIAENAQIINLSIAGAHDAILTMLIEEAVNRGIVVVSVLDDSADKRFPGSAPGVLPVTSGDRSRPSETPAHSVRAPGTEVLSALPGKRYGTLTGVSASTAVTSGVVALLLQRKPHMGTGVIVEQLRRSADPVSGSIHACRAVADAIGVRCPDAPTGSAD